MSRRKHPSYRTFLPQSTRPFPRKPSRIRTLQVRLWAYRSRSYTSTNRRRIYRTFPVSRIPIHRRRSRCRRLISSQICSTARNIRPVSSLNSHSSSRTLRNCRSKVKCKTSLSRAISKKLKRPQRKRSKMVRTKFLIRNNNTRGSIGVR